MKSTNSPKETLPKNSDGARELPPNPRLVKLFTNCSGGPCPTIYKDANDDYVVQGYKVDEAGRNGAIVPGHEDVVRIPKEFLDQYIQSRSKV